MSSENVGNSKLENTILYLLRECPRRPGVTALLKMLYFADMRHYRRYLRTITNARYVALQRGPVPEDYKTLFENMERDRLVRLNEVPVFQRDNPKQEYEPLVAPAVEMLTETERDVLAEVIQECGERTGSDLSELSHREGPWQMFWNAANEGAAIPPSAFRWLDNMPDESDLDRARAAVKGSDVQQCLESLEPVGV